jgi:hypothetical protein
MKSEAREKRPLRGVGERRMLSFDRKKIGNILEVLGKVVRSYRFALAAFLIPVFIRSIPEILVGPYPVGWDTIAFYVPNTLDWAAGKAGFTEILGTAPLMYMISVPIYWVSRINPVWIFKIMGPVLYGSMIWALFRFLKIGLKWPDKQALGGALLTSLYFVTLRISWDLYRNMLGLTFILLSLPMIEDIKGPRKQALLSALIVLAVAADPLTGVIALVLIGARALLGLTRNQREEFLRMTKVALPGIVLFLATAYAGLIAPGIGLVSQQPPVPTLTSASVSLGFLGYAYLALAPLVLIGLRRVPNVELRTWSVFCTATVATAILPFFGPIVESYRWSLLLDIPLCIFAAAGLYKLVESIHPRTGLARNFRRLILPTFSAVLMVSAMLYIALPAQQAAMYYTAYPELLPTSMIQNTIPLSDLGNLRSLLDSAAARINSGTVLITHQAIYGWARAYLPSLNNQLINYKYSAPLTGVEIAKSEGYSSILMIWWIDGSGWHNQPDVPSGFRVLLQNGDLALYTYN